MTEQEHIERHKELHQMLDELMADFINCTTKSLTNTNLIEFMEWSHKQTLNPDEDRVNILDKSEQGDKHESNVKTIKGT